MTQTSPANGVLDKDGPRSDKDVDNALTAATTSDGSTTESDDDDSESLTTEASDLEVSCTSFHAFHSTAKKEILVAVPVRYRYR
jgi:hypothetical protein